jgi:hypothetical protein
VLTTSSSVSGRSARATRILLTAKESEGVRDQQIVRQARKLGNELGFMGHKHFVLREDNHPSIGDFGEDHQIKGVPSRLGQL